MLQHLNGGRADGSWDRRLGNYLRPDLLILDDFGLKPIQPPGPEDLYDVINERYERSSILLTSNRAPNEWPDLFLDQQQAIFQDVSLWSQLEPERQTQLAQRLAELIQRMRKDAYREKNSHERP
jgi:DNA replication protein DnaC